MLEDQVAYLLQKYLGNYVRGFNKEALKISVWNGSNLSLIHFFSFLKFYYEASCVLRSSSLLRNGSDLGI